MSSRRDTRGFTRHRPATNAARVLERIGFKGSPVFGKLMAQRIAAGTTPALIAPFAPDRFERDRMVPDAASAGTH